MAHGKHFYVNVGGVHREDSDARFRQLINGFVASLRTAGYAAEVVVQDWHEEDADEGTVAAAIAGQPTVREFHRERAAKAPPEPAGEGEPEERGPGDLEEPPA